MKFEIEVCEKKNHYLNSDSYVTFKKEVSYNETPLSAQIEFEKKEFNLVRAVEGDYYKKEIKIKEHWMGGSNLPYIEKELVERGWQK